jgi:subtilase family serine protease
MNSLKAMKLLFLPLAMGLFTQAVYGQSYPLVPSTPPGTFRPPVWLIGGAASPSTTFVHGPGVPNCGPGAAVVCYYLPFDLQTAYATNFIPNANGGAGLTIGIVDAYYYAGAENDLNHFASSFGLPPCTVASGCLTQINQTGTVLPHPPVDPDPQQGWAVETMLDLEWAHVMAPNAHLLLVEGNSNSFADLGTAVLTAQVRADVVSNSYGANEGGGESTLDFYYTGSTVPILFSSGDTGAVSEYPCASPFVVCVGGTSLFETATSYRSVEKGWSGSGGGCSGFEPVQPWEAPYSSPKCGATSRGVPDTAALADPYTGVVLYISPPLAGVGSPGLYISFGGTSLACPMTAGLVADMDASRIAAGKSRLGGFASANFLSQLLYNAAANPFYHYRYYDVTLGSSGFPATPGWDLVTGLGVPLGPALANYFDTLP